MGRRGREVGLRVWLEDAGYHRVASGIKDQASLPQHGQPDAMHIAMHFSLFVKDLSRISLHQPLQTQSATMLRLLQVASFLLSSLDALFPFVFSCLSAPESPCRRRFTAHAMHYQSITPKSDPRASGAVTCTSLHSTVVNAAHTGSPGLT